ncbi:MAG: MFS transporter [Planctomycetota bacterium]|nr:MAG: MFS transporter [Planctomycetota bacterium]
MIMTIVPNGKPAEHFARRPPALNFRQPQGRGWRDPLHSANRTKSACPNPPPMPHPVADVARPASDSRSVPAENQDRRVEIESHEPRNLIALAAYQVMLRVGWIFKTESVIMPAFLDAIAGAGWIRGFLPVLNRLGQSVPPMCFADSLRGIRVKKRALVTSSILMATPFLLLSAIWSGLEEPRQPWLPPLFLLLYLLFFCFTGLNQLAFGTVQGKLIRPHRRGRLMGWAGVAGSLAAVTAAWLLLRPWLARPDNSGFGLVFLFNGAAFACAGLIAAVCVEPADDRRPRASIDIRRHVRKAWRVYRDDEAFRRAARVGMLFISSILLFPHYQWLGRTRLGTTNEDLIYWVVAQNLSVGVFSPLIGRIADRNGNRLAVRIAVFVASLTPLSALVLAAFDPETGRRWYWLTFVLLGLTPVTMRTIQNYTLELVDESQHPRYLSTMTVCFAMPFILSPFFGGLIDVLPYQIPFILVSVLIAAGGLFTFRMVEPRHRDRSPARPT